MASPHDKGSGVHVLGDVQAAEQDQGECVRMPDRPWAGQLHRLLATTINTKVHKVG